MNYLVNLYNILEYLKKGSGSFLVEVSVDEDSVGKELVFIFYNEKYGDPIAIKLRNDMLTGIHPDDILTELSHIVDTTSLYYHSGNNTIN